MTQHESTMNLYESSLLKQNMKHPEFKETGK